jgi:signal transduction histidine kinase
MRVPRAERWTLVSTASEARSWAEALSSKGVEVAMSESAEDVGRSAVVVVHGVAVTRPTDAVVLELPEAVARASPEVVAEYLLAREAAARATRELEAFKRDQMGVVHKITHDLNNDIAVVRANLNYLQSTIAPTRDMAEALDEATDSSRLMEQTLADLRLMAALEQGQYPLTRESVRLEPVIEGAVAALRRRFEARSIEPAVHVEGELAAYGQPSMLTWVIGALLGMRARAARRSKLEIRAWLDGGQVHLTVADSGTGVLPSDAELVLARGSVNSRSARELGSTGVSLYLARLISEVHGGALTVVDLPPWTCAFRLRLPAPPADT